MGIINGKKHIEVTPSLRIRRKGEIAGNDCE
jgi:hypothetical protein